VQTRRIQDNVLVVVGVGTSGGIDKVHRAVVIQHRFGRSMGVLSKRTALQTQRTWFAPFIVGDVPHLKPRSLRRPQLIAVVTIVPGLIGRADGQEPAVGKT